MKSSSRRTFLTRTLAVTAVFAVGRRVLAQASSPAAMDSASPKPPADRTRPTHDPELAKEFVSACHRDLARVQAMVAREPRLVFAAVDTGNVGIGDWETGLNGASHTGRRDIVEFLLANGARIDAFAMAMLGQRGVMLALLEANPRVAVVKGPHNLSLLYHAAIGGDVAIAQAIKPHLPPNAADFNQALGAAARDGRLEMTQWLLENGVTDVNAPDGFRKTPLRIAQEKGFSDVAAVLKAHGAR